MALIRWDPYHVLSRLDQDFDDLVRRTWGSSERTLMGYVPAVDMSMEGPDVKIRLELPGIDVDRDVDIEVADGMLIVRGERREEEVEESHGRLLVRELRYGSFEREFALPEGVTADSVDATYDQGILQIMVKNVAKAVPEAKKVAIKARSASPHSVEGSAKRQASG